MVLASLNPVQRGVRNTNPLRKGSVGKAASDLPQILRELAIQIPTHAERMAKSASRMRDDFRLHGVSFLIPARLWKQVRSSNKDRLLCGLEFAGG